MIAELLSVGTELLLGEIVDTNSAWLAQDLAQRGVDVLWSQRVGDNLERLKRAIQQALSRSDVLIMCGGLGPTGDDLSREAIAEVLGETPTVDPELERALRERFASFSRRMPEQNVKQAWLIPSAESLPNPHGTAPGWLVSAQLGGKDNRIVCLPGPPRELKPMWLEQAVPRLDLPPAALYSTTFKTFDLGESSAAERLGELTNGANPSVATYARHDGVHVRVASKADTAEQAKTLAQATEAKVADILAGHIWGRDHEELPELIRVLLEAKQRRLATMESLTGGMIGEILTSVAGASAVYSGGVVTYTAQAKVAFGVPQELLKTQGSVSGEVATAMAKAAKERFQADYGLATTGVAGPAKAEGQPVGEVYIALYDGTEPILKHLTLPALERNWVRERTTFTALALLWSQLHARQ